MARFLYVIADGGLGVVWAGGSVNLIDDPSVRPFIRLLMERG